MVRAIRELGGDCDWLIPGRQEDGYGLTMATVERLTARGTALLITADCGIGSVDEVARGAGGRDRGDRHRSPPARRPTARLPDPAPGPRGYPFAELCATGVAYKLARGAARSARRPSAELDLVALATVADLVPLRGENRALVRRGLEVARRARRPGLRALMASSARIAPSDSTRATSASGSAPRINAAGRLYRADAGVELMLTADEARATEIATELERANHERREVERDVLAAAEASRAELPDELGDAAGLVLAGAGLAPRASSGSSPRGSPSVTTGPPS